MRDVHAFVTRGRDRERVKVEPSKLTIGLVLGVLVTGVVVWKMSSPSQRTEPPGPMEAIFQPRERDEERREAYAVDERLSVSAAADVAQADHEGELVEVSPLELGLPEDIAARYDQGFLYTGTAVPGSEPKPLSHPEMPAGTVTEAELRAKEDRLVELYPAMKKKIEASRGEREKSAADFKERGMGPTDWALKNEVQLEE